MSKKEEKWETRPFDADPHRYVVDQDNVLVADCYPDTWEDYGLPSVRLYQLRSQMISLLPEMIRELRRCRYQVTADPPGRKLWNKIEELQRQIQEAENYDELRE